MSSDPANGFASIPTATGGIARLVVERLEAEGRAIAPILLRAGISRGQIVDPAARIQTMAQCRLLELAAETLGDDLLGFHLAREFDLRRIGLLYYVMASARDLPSAFLDGQRYSRIVNEGVRALFRREARPVVAVEHHGIVGPASRHHSEFWITTLIRICRQLSGSRIAPLAVRMRHLRVRAPAEMRAFFGVEPEFGAPADEIVLPAMAMDLGLASADPYLNDLLRGYADRALAERGKHGKGVRDRIERLLPCLLPHGRASAAEIARELGLSRRTLSRQLHAEGAGLPEIVERVRTALAVSYLEDDHIPITQIAWLLGYREVSSFTNAFRAWTGSSPSEVRAAARRRESAGPPPARGTTASPV